MYPLEFFEILSSKKNEIPVVDMKEFISHITYFTWDKLYKETGKRVDFSLDCESISLESQYAIPLALVVSEALSNSLQYAFHKEENRDRIEVRFGWSKNKDRLFLKVRDNGIGFTQTQTIEIPEKVQTIRQGLGLKIIEGMALLLGGEYYLNGDQGTIIELIFSYSPA
jgi:two-component system, sensor histidine kinase PdtaS